MKRIQRKQILALLTTAALTIAFAGCGTSNTPTEESAETTSTADQELSLELTDAARTQVIENGYDPVYGARPLKRYLQNYVETLAAKKILSGDVHQGDTLVLDVKDGEFVINTK